MFIDVNETFSNCPILKSVIIIIIIIINIIIIAIIIIIIIIILLTIANIINIFLFTPVKAKSIRIDSSMQRIDWLCIALLSIRICFND